MTEKNIEKLDSIFTRLFFINNGAKSIKDRCYTANLDFTLNNRYPMFILEAVEMKCKSNKYKCEWLSTSDLYVQMKYASVVIRKIK